MTNAKKRNVLVLVTTFVIMFVITLVSLPNTTKAQLAPDTFVTVYEDRVTTRIDHDDGVTIRTVYEPGERPGATVGTDSETENVAVTPINIISTNDLILTQSRVSSLSTELAGLVRVTASADFLNETMRNDLNRIVTELEMLVDDYNNIISNSGVNFSR